MLVLRTADALRYASILMNKGSPSTLLLHGRIDVKVCVSHISQKARDMGHPLICGRERSLGRRFLYSLVYSSALFCSLPG